MSHGHSHGGGDATAPLLKEEHGHGDHGHAEHGQAEHGGGGHGGHGHEEHGAKGHDAHDVEGGCCGGHGDDHGEKAHGGHGGHGGGHDHGHAHGDGGHQCDHHKGPSEDIRKMKNAIYFAMFFMLVEIVGGIVANSLAIITDAAHMLSDVGGFMVSLVALHLSEMAATQQYSYGFQQADVLGALFSIMIVWGLTAVLLAESIPRFIEPVEVEGKIMLVIACIGFVVNLILMKVLGHGHAHGDGDDHGHAHGGEGEKNSAAVQAALAHVIGDIVQSLGVCVAAFLMWQQPFDIGTVETSKGPVSKWYYADPLCTVLFGILVLNTTKATVKRTVSTLMARAPDSINQDALAAAFNKIPEVISIHDLHVWSLGSKEVLCTAHILIKNKDRSMDVLKGAIKVAQSNGIGHSTFQIEIAGEFDPALEDFGTLHKNPLGDAGNGDAGHGHGEDHGHKAHGEAHQAHGEHGAHGGGGGHAH